MVKMKNPDFALHLYRFEAADEGDDDRFKLGGGDRLVRIVYRGRMCQPVALAEEGAVVFVKACELGLEGSCRSERAASTRAAEAPKPFVSILTSLSNGFKTTPPMSFQSETKASARRDLRRSEGGWRFRDDGCATNEKSPAPAFWQPRRRAIGPRALLSGMASSARIVVRVLNVPRTHHCSTPVSPSCSRRGQQNNRLRTPLMGTPITIGGIPLPSDTLLFLTLVALHVTTGITCVVAGVVAMLSRKQRGSHPRAGTIYYWALAIVFVTMSALSISRWAEDYHLFALGALSFIAATIGRTARRRLWSAWARVHMTGMGASYILLITAFYVANGPNLPLWRPSHSL
jgi:hypothetical protein